MFKRTEFSKQFKLINLCLNVIIHITEYSPKPPTPGQPEYSTNNSKHVPTIQTNILTTKWNSRMLL